MPPRFQVSLTGLFIAILLPACGRQADQLGTQITPVQNQDRIQAGRFLYEVSCASCHQPDGEGMPGVGPPLINSEWVQGSEQQLIAIVLQGVRGPIRVQDQEYNLEMPAMGFFEDDQLAAILTYIRNAWGNQGSEIPADKISSFRKETLTRRDSWTVSELMSLP